MDAKTKNGIVGENMNLDYSLFLMINGLAGKMAVLDHIMTVTAKYMPALYVVLLMLLWLSGTRAAKRTAVYSFLAAVLALGLAQIPGWFYFRPRPFAQHSVNLLIDRSPDPSFPSDHATGSAALAAGIMSGSKKLGYFAWIMVVALSFSRVYVGTHYPLDVAAGILIGVLANVLVQKTSRVTLPMVDYIISIIEKWIPVKTEPVRFDKHLEP